MENEKEQRVHAFWEFSSVGQLLKRSMCIYGNTC
jgi:hypothetical protein